MSTKIISTSSTGVELDMPTQHDVKISSRNYKLISSCMLDLANGVAIPDWLTDSIVTQIADGTLTLTEALNNLTIFVNSLETGINQQISALQTEDLSQHSLLTTNVSRIDNNVAAAVTLTNTKVDADGATAASMDLLNSQFNTPNSEAQSWFLNQSATIANAVESSATQLTALVASYNDLSVRVTSTETATAGLFTVTESPTVPTVARVGDIWIDTSVTPNIQYQYLGVGIGWTRTDESVATDLTALESTFQGLIGDLQTQLDNEITTWFEEGVPYTITYPANQWTTTDEKNVHLGDLYYDTDSGAGYRYVVNGTTYSWVVITDTAITAALEAASTAQSTADGKIVTFYQTSAPSGASLGDIWFDSNDGNKMYRYNGSSWVSAQDQGISWAANASKLITAPDGSITGWAFADGSNTSSVFKVYATNFSISDGVTGYTPFSISGNQVAFDGLVTFSNISDRASNIPTIASVTDAQNSANTGIANAATALTAAQLATLPSEVAAAVNNNTTTISGSKITTGSIYASRIASYTLTATNATLASAMIKNAHIANAQITNAKIGTAAITNAKIDNLAVDTLKIGNNAVTVPASLYSGTDRAGTGSAIEIGRMSMYVGTSNITVFTLCEITQAWYGGGAWNLVLQRYTSADPVWRQVGFSASPSQQGTATVMCTSSGSGTYYIRALWTGASGMLLGSVNMYMIGTKK